MPSDGEGTGSMKMFRGTGSGKSPRPSDLRASLAAGTGGEPGQERVLFGAGMQGGSERGE